MRTQSGKKVHSKAKSASKSTSVGEKAPLSQEKMLRLLFENMVQGVIVLDAQNRIVSANQAAVKWSGLSEDQFFNSRLTEHGWNFFHDDGSPYTPEEMPSSIARRTGRSVANAIMGVSMPGKGLFRWISVDAVPRFDKENIEPHFILITITDISERVRSEEQIRMLKYSIDTHRDSFYWTDAEGKIVYANDAACTNLGYKRYELIGQSITLFNRQVDMQFIRRTAASLRSQGTHVFESVHHRKDGSEFPVEIRLSYLQFGGKEYVLGYARDITERIRIEQERARLEDQIRQAQRMESIGRLAGGLAHDFNNLLTAISGHISLALMDLNPMDPLRPSLVEASKAAESAAGLTRQLLTLSRTPALNLRRIDLNGLVADLQKMLKRLVGEDVRLRAILKADHAIINADPGQIEQIIINLAINAGDAMPEGGVLTIETKCVQVGEGGDRSYPNAKPGRYILVAVRDTGQGIPEEVQKHLFEPFYTTKEIGKGTGLGLATVYGAVMQNHGFIDVDSKVGSGTTFNVLFPLADDGPAEIWKREMEDKDLPKGSETIVLVEDDKIVREMTLKLLKRLGYSVLAYSNGNKAFLDLQNVAIRFRLLVTDVIMQGMNGGVLAEKLTDLRPNLRVLFTSGYAEDLIARRGLPDQEINFIGKPYSPKELAKKIREILDAS